jgi:hypothetical protein
MQVREFVKRRVKGTNVLEEGSSKVEDEVDASPPVRVSVTGTTLLGVGLEE